MQDRDNALVRSMVMTKPELLIDEYIEWFRDLTGRVISLATMCRTIIRLGFTYKKVSFFNSYKIYLSLSIVDRGEILCSSEGIKNVRML